MCRSTAATSAARVSAIVVCVPVILIPKVPATVAVVMPAPSPSFAVMVVKIPEPIDMVLLGTKCFGLEEGGTVDGNRVVIGEVNGVVKKGVAAIGKAMHAVRENRGRKNQTDNQ